MASQPLTIAILGCGSRGRTYAKLIGDMPQRYRLVAAADPNAVRLSQVVEYANNPEFQAFANADEFFAAGKLADVLIIATQDSQHYAQVMQALHLDYHLLLEKPAAQTIEEIHEIRDLAIARQRKIALCFVLRYTPFYRAVHETIAAGKVGQVIHIEATEGVGAFHQAHSFVRGHWSKTAESTPMIIAKCSHDTDLISWLIGDTQATRVTSLGGLSWFTAANAPKGATDRCVNGCPHYDNCRYSTKHYLNEQRRWLDFVFPTKAEDATDEEIVEWLKHSRWGRCAWLCDNDVVDHQSLSVEFANGATASLVMSAFERGRQITIHGTEATLRGGDPWNHPGEMQLQIRRHEDKEASAVPLDLASSEGYAGHGGGDFGIIDSLDQIFSDQVDCRSLIDASLQSHLIGFAAEQSRLAGGMPIQIN